MASINLSYVLEPREKNRDMVQNKVQFDKEKKATELATRRSSKLRLDSRSFIFDSQAAQ